tara:strand:- start:107 stop:880 length:774 start_codon:yes stop_codon:yes gene_type:complete
MSTNIKKTVKELTSIIDARPPNIANILIYVREHVDDAHVCERGVQAAWNLMFYEASNKKRALDAEIIELCKETLVLHARHKQVGRPIVRNALFVFKEMANVCESTSEKIKATHKKQIFDRCMEMGLSNIIIDYLKLYSGTVGGYVFDPKIQEAGAASLGWCCLKATKDYKAKVIAYGGVERMEFILKTCSKNPHILRYAKWTFNMLLEAKEEYERDMLIERERIERQKMILKMAKGAKLNDGKKKKKKKAMFTEVDD